MNKLLFLLLLALTAHAAEPRIALLIFEYPELDLADSNSVTFVAHAAPSLPPAGFQPMWVPAASFNSGHASFRRDATNNVNGTNLVTVSFPMPVSAGQKFFVVNATNEWGASPFSNAAQIMGVPPGGSNLRLVPLNRPQLERELTPAQRREAIERANRNQPPIPR